MCHKETCVLRDITKFQQRVVQQWNPDSSKATPLLNFPVALRDKIKPNGYGITIIEILCLPCLLIHVVSEDGV